MGRQPCCDKAGLKRGPWTIEEDHKLMNFILNNGIHCWRAVPKLAGIISFVKNLFTCCDFALKLCYLNSAFFLFLSVWHCGEGLLRCGKSCRLRWINYLRPDLKRGGFTEMEEDQIIQLHSCLGNRCLCYMFLYFLCRKNLWHGFWTVYLKNLSSVYID
ncbi:hypothetical protein V8G54_012664 [Vigna mungo]|uniref:Uncharacterized protein n=1 Tax=Vigna mungo TaxID=3915 RepID=A0AAQ3NV63_VIGMU